MKYFYFLFLAMIAASIAFLGYYMATGDSILWQQFTFAYLVLAIASIWYTALLLMKEDIRPRKRGRYDGEKFAVVMPCYNESINDLEYAIESATKAEGNKMVFVIDDGSTNGVGDELPQLEEKYGIKWHRFAKNMGKREALHYAITHLPEDIKYVITSDSDTIFKWNSFTKMVGALKGKNVGACSGDVQLLNENENWLTRMIGAYYWTALNINRQAQSALGQVACCSGALAGYRRALVERGAQEMVNETFLGKKCTYGEDRHLTSLVLREGYDVVYVPEAVAYTETPSKLKQFLKQQIRWRRGFVQEAAFSLPFLWKVKPALFLEIMISDIAVPYLGMGIVVAALFEMLAHPSAVLIYLPALAYVAIFRHLPVLFKSPKRILPLIAFSIFSFFITYWQGIYALATVRNTKWVTR